MILILPLRMTLVYWPSDLLGVFESCLLAGCPDIFKDIVGSPAESLVIGFSEIVRLCINQMAARC